MIRPSALALAKYCGYSVKLAEENPEGSTASEKGTKFHAEMAEYIRTGKTSDTRLTAIWACMPPHAKAEPEVPMKLVDTEDDNVLSEGTADLVLTHDDGSITVNDWKTGQMDKVDRPDENLQLLAYGLGIAMERGAPKFRVGLYFTEYPPLQLSRWFVDGADYYAVLAMIKEAMSKDRETPITGSHCDRCYRRSKCSAWMLPASLGATALEPFTKPSGLTKDNAAQAIYVVKAMKDAIEVADAQLKTFARENGGIHDGNGKVWAPGTRNGRRSVSLDKCEEAGLMPQLEAAGCVNTGGTFEVFAWKNATAKKAVKGGASEWKDEK